MTTRQRAVAEWRRAALHCPLAIAACVAVASAGTRRRFLRADGLRHLRRQLVLRFLRWPQPLRGVGSGHE